MTEAATKQPGKIQQLFGLWEKAGDGELLPRAIELAVAEGVNPSTARTQCRSTRLTVLPRAIQTPVERAGAVSCTAAMSRSQGLAL